MLAARVDRRAGAVPAGAGGVAATAALQKQGIQEFGAIIRAAGIQPQ